MTHNQPSPAESPASGDTDSDFFMRLAKSMRQTSCRNSRDVVEIRSITGERLERIAAALVLLQAQVSKQNDEIAELRREAEDAARFSASLIQAGRWDVRPAAEGGANEQRN